MLKGQKLRGLQLIKETSQGSGDAASKLHKNITFKNTRKNNVKTSEAEGHRHAIGQTRGKKWSEWTANGDLGYNLMPLIGAGLFDASGGTPTGPTSTSVYTYTQQEINGTLHTPQTFAFEYGNSIGSNSKFAFGVISDFDMKFSSNNPEVTYSMGGFGAYPTKNISMTSTPTIIDPVLCNYTDGNMYYATTFAGLGAGKLTTAKDFEISIKGKYKAQFFIDAATTSFGGILEKKPTTTGKITVAEGTESDYFLGDLEASTPFWIQLILTGPTIAVSSPTAYNKITLTLALLLEQEEETDSDDLFAGMYSFYGAEDTTNGDINLVCLNALSTI